MKARTGSGQLPDDFAAKADYIPSSPQLGERPWVRVLAFGLACAAGLLGAVALGMFRNWHDTQEADLARQRRCFAVFLQSEEFAQFARAADAQFVALNNFIATQPAVARDTLPEAKAFEQAHRVMPWTTEVLPLPVSVSAQPMRVLAAHRTINVLLAQRGCRLSHDATGQAGRQLLLRLLAPAMQTFLRRQTGNAFPAVAFDHAMQDAAFAAFAQRHGVDACVHDAERMFALYAKIGPAMWHAIEQEGTRKAKTTFANSAF